MQMYSRDDMVVQSDTSQRAWQEINESFALFRIGHFLLSRLRGVNARAASPHACEHVSPSRDECMHAQSLS
jgi:hypothetical protein